jgi:von Willebrand factor type A domain
LASVLADGIEGMPDGERNPPFYESRTFKGAAAVVTLATAVLALIGPLNGVVGALFPSGEKPVSWVEVVLDTSAAMEASFGGKSKLEAANGAIAKAVKELDNEGVGLRRSATSCDAKSEQLVDLAAGHNDEVIDEAQSQQPKGDASIVDAIVGGLEEFRREPMASGNPGSRRLLVFTAGVNECSHGDLAAEIAEELEGADVSKASKVEVFALGASSEEERRLEEFKSALGEYANVKLHTPESTRELNGEAEAAAESVSGTTEQLEEERQDGLYPQP